jgi:putative transposase
MARAKRHFIPDYIWHITHRCHKREFLLKFAKDRHRYLQWLYQARKKYGLKILNYMVTSNHTHLLVVDDGDRNVIPNSMKLVAGRTGQEYNQRKNRRGAYWEDRYHATAVESGDHLAKCMSLSCNGSRKRRSSGKMHGLHRYEYGTSRCGQPSSHVALLWLQ